MAIFLPAFFVNFSGDPYDAAGKKKLLNLPELIDAKGSWKVDANTQFSDWFNKNLGFRAQLTGIYNFIETKFFGILPDKNADAGQNNGFGHTADDFPGTK
jgi:hypothetical protein